MNTTKKLFVLTLIAVLAVVSFVPSTFSWYSHNDSQDGQNIWYHGSVPMSVKSNSTGSDITMATYLSDVNGAVGAQLGASAGVSLAANADSDVQYYKTIFTNTGNNDVMVDLGAVNLKNNADFILGTVSPTVDEKAFASRASRETKTPTTFRVYFKTYLPFNNFWSVDNGTLDSTSQKGPGNGTTNDINIAYVQNETTYYYRMNRCEKDGNPSVDSNWDKTGTYVYYFDLPVNIDHFFFFNHYYFTDTTNQDWNQTPDIKDKSQGKLYYLNGGDQGNGKFKTVSVKTDYAEELVSLNRYYSSVSMSKGTSVTADISLKSSTDDDEAIPDYYGTDISYSIPTASHRNYISVSRDGLITPKAYTGSATPKVRTTIKGKFGDTYYFDTVVNIPNNIAQVQIIKNVRIPAKGTVDSEGNEVSNKVEIHWYALNKNASESMTTGKLFFTL